MSAIMKIALAALVAGAVQAVPANLAPSGGSSMHHTSQGSGSSPSATKTMGGSQTIGFPEFSTPPADAAAKASALAEKLQTKVTQVDRLQILLSEDQEGKIPLSDPDQVHDAIAFDFKNAPAGGEGGRILVANEDNFPFLVGEGIAGAVAFLEPCGMNSPHTHPRATEFLTVVEGELVTGFVLENGFFKDAAKEINALAFPFNTTLNRFEATIFPQGSIHFQFNPTCERAIFVASLNSADPGTSQVAQNFFTLDQDIVDITLGPKNKIDPSNVDKFRANLPPNLVRAVDSCMATCKL
ncbi:hypothetical protein Q7P37_006428 [Cladosporium fusiforme]